MTITNLILLLAFALISAAGLLAMFKLSFKYRWFDVPVERSSHTRIVPRTAGISIALLAILSLVFWGPDDFQSPIIYFSFVTFFLIGIYDDIKHVKASSKFWAQLIIAASISIFLPNFRIDNFYGVLGIHAIGEMFSIIFTTFVFVVVINAYNLIDGVDGLAASFSVFAIYLIGLCFKDINLSIFQFCNVLIAILLPFFFINFSKKHKMFLGDTGSLFLGTTIILFVGYLLNSNNAVHVPCNMNRALYALVALCYPLLDTLRVFTLRLTRGQSPFRADKSHLHHKLLGLGFSHFTTTASLLTFNIIIYLINLSLINEVDVNAVLVADFMLIGFFFIGGLWYTRLNKSVHE
jgi:UDP-N-acetylmuramyl pentapeptide phosphotransferase/UDP-N-acetylglucosamine-1-phosphate transferase